jgi:MFS family permease
MSEHLSEAGNPIVASVQNDGAKPKLHQHSAALLFGMLLCMVAVMGQTGFLGMFTPALRQTLELSHSAYGGLYCAATMLSGFSLLFAGGIVDRFRLPVVCVAVLTLMLIAAALLAFATTYWSVLAGIMLMRFTGQAMLPNVAIIAASRYFQQDRGKALSIITLGGPLADAMLPVLALALIQNHSWRYGFGLVGGVTLVLGGLAIWLLQHQKLRSIHAPPRAMPAAEQPPGVRFAAALQDRGFWALVLAAGMPAMLGSGLFFFQLPIAKLKGWALQDFASAYTFMAIATVSGLIMFGRWVDRFGAQRIAWWNYPPLFGALAVLAFSSHPKAVFGYLLLCGLSSGANWAISGVVFADRYGLRDLARIRAAYLSLCVFGTATSPFVFGYLFDHQISALTLAGYSAVAVVIATVAAWMLPRLPPPPENATVNAAGPKQQNTAQL